MYRVTRTNVRGQFANQDCFAVWLAAQAGTLFFIKTAPDPQNNGGPNDHTYFLWNQLADVPQPKCATPPDLVTSNGRNGWDTQAEAQAVLDHELGQSKAIGDAAKAANAAAVSPGNLVDSALKDAGNAIDDLKNPFSSPFVWLGGLALGGIVLWKVLK